MIDGPRAARREEIESVVQLADQVFTQGTRPSMGELYPLIFDPQHPDAMRVIFEDGRPVSLIGVVVRDGFILGRRCRIACIGSVCTEPEARGKGLATRLLEDTLELCRARKVQLLLVSGGRGLYFRQGCVAAGQFNRWTVRLDAVPPVPAGLSAEVARAREIPELAQLHQGEPTRFCRSRRDWKRLLACRNVVDQSGDVFLIHFEGQAVAYAAVQRAVPGQDVAFISELGGSRRAVVEAIPAMVAGAEEVARLSCQAGDTEMNYWMTRCSAERESHSGEDSTARLIDLRGFLREMMPVLRERAQSLRRSFRLRHRDDGLEVKSGRESVLLQDPAAIAQLLFNGPQAEIAELVGQDKLTEAAVGILPIPRPLYGLNFQ